MLRFPVISIGEVTGYVYTNTIGQGGIFLF